MADRDEKYVIIHQTMRSQVLTRLAGSIATSEIVLRYGLSTLTKRNDFKFSRFLIFLIYLLLTFFKSKQNIYQEYEKSGNLVPYDNKAILILLVGNYDF